MKQIENDTPNTEISASPSLFIELQQLIISSKSKLASHVNSAISQLYWQIGKQINDELLKQKRADYGKQIVKSLSEKLTEEFGKGFNYSALTRMQKFYLSFSEYEIVATLSQQLSWSHFILLLAIKNQQAQDFYAHMSATEHWSVRTLRSRIDSMLFERTALSNKPQEMVNHELAQLKDKKITPNLLLKDPYLLDFLELKDHYLEKDLEDGILRELELFYYS